MGQAKPSDDNELRLREISAGLQVFFRRKLGTGADADDMVHDTLVRLLRQPVQSRDLSNAFVFTVAKNLLRDRFRKLRVRTHFDREAALDVQEMLSAGSVAFDAERVLIGKEGVAQLIAALRELSDRTRHIFLLYRVEGWSHREIAVHFGISASAVEKNVAKALVHLTKRTSSR